MGKAWEDYERKLLAAAERSRELGERLRLTKNEQDRQALIREIEQADRQHSEYLKKMLDAFDSHH